MTIDITTIQSRDACKALDEVDCFAQKRSLFALPEGVIYLDGNSLGARPKSALEVAHRVVEEEWGNSLIKSWNTAGWWDMPRTLGDRIGKLVGAADGEVIVTDTTGINLFKLLALAIECNPDRPVILMESDNFPTDTYMGQGLAKLLGDRVQIKLVAGDDIAAAIDENVAVVSVTQVNYKTGRKLDMKEITKVAHAKGALMCWDLCHSAGAVPVDLNDAQVDFAVGCTYKYLNAGPGAQAFAFVAKRHQGKAQQPITGWWGHARPFAFETDYAPAASIDQMLTGTQPITSMAMIASGLDAFDGVDMQALYEKGQALGDLFISLVEQRCAGFGLELNSPRDKNTRGSQVSFNHEHGYAVVKALIDKGVIGDFRAPFNMRFGFASLYVRYVDVWDSVEHLRQILESESWKDPKYMTKEAVT